MMATSSQQAAALREAEEAAAREAAKEARRNVLRGEIAALTTEINSLSTLRNSYDTKKTNIQNSTEEWKGYKLSIEADDFYSSVKKIDVFEGDTADNQAVKLPNAISKMNKSWSDMQSYATVVGTQISKIDSEITRLNNEKAAKQSELNSI